MDNKMRAFDDVFYELYIKENIFPLSENVKEIDRFADNIIAEVARYKKEIRQAKRKIQSVEKSSVVSRNYLNEPPKNVDEEMEMAMFGEQFVIENYQINYRDAFTEINMMIEGDSLMPEEIQKKLGVSVDSRSLSKWGQRHIKWQAWAQTLKFFDQMANVKNIQDQMLRDQKLVALFGIKDVLTSIAIPGSRGRSLEDVIRFVIPNRKKGRSLKKAAIFNKNEVILIPKVYDTITKKLNLKGLKIAIVTVSQVLALKNMGFKEIAQHPVIKVYKAITSPLFSVFIDWWITEALENL